MLPLILSDLLLKMNFV